AILAQRRIRRAAPVMDVAQLAELGPDPSELAFKLLRHHHAAIERALVTGCREALVLWIPRWLEVWHVAIDAQRLICRRSGVQRYGTAVLIARARYRVISV